MDAKLAGRTISHRTSCIRRVFRWACEEELIPPSTYYGLAAVRGPDPRRAGVKAPKKIKPPPGAVEATLSFLPQVVADMVRLQRLTAMRSGELCRMTPGEIEQKGDIWYCRPGCHKGDWRALKKVVMIGPQAQKILAPYLKNRPAGTPGFAPAEAQTQRNAKNRSERKSEVQPSQVDRRKPDPKRTAGEACGSRSHGRAICYAILAARRAGKEVADWHPRQLRHEAATRITEAHGIEAAQVILGHRTLDVTGIYVERDLALARRVVQDIG